MTLNELKILAKKPWHWLRWGYVRRGLKLGREMARVDLPAGIRRFTLKTSDFRADVYFVQAASEVRARVIPVMLIG